MKKIIILILTIFICVKTYALELKYSEWSPIYPGEVKDKKLIFEQNRYLWYKEIETNIKYLKKEDIKHNDNVLYDDFKFNTYSSFIEPEKYEEREIKSSFQFYTFKDEDITNLLLDKIGNIDIAEIYLVDNDGNNLSYIFDLPNELNDGEFNYINYKDKEINLSFNNFNKTNKIIIFYSSSNNQTIDLSYRANNNYIVYSNTFKFKECEKCKVEIDIDEFNSFVMQYIEIFDVRDKLYKTYDIEKEYTNDYYTYLEGYKKDENTLKKHYRFILNDYVIIDADGNIVKDESCYKETCFIKYLEYNEDEEIINPKTNDKTYKYIISSVGIITLIIFLYVKNLVLSKCNISK